MADAAMSWTSHPARTRPCAALGALAAIAAMGALVGVTMGDWLFGALAIVALMLATASFFLPTRMRVNSEGVEVIYPLSRRTLAWNAIGFVAWSPRGVWLATGPSRRAIARGVQLDLYALSTDDSLRLRGIVAQHTPAEAWR